MKILIAEDDPILQKLNSRLMGGWGYDFDMVSNGSEAVEFVKKNKGGYDLCLMDIDMPIMNGLEATRIIRQKVKYFPIMALSGNPEYREKCLEIGMDYFMVKPFCLDNLFAKLNELIVKFFKFEIKEKKYFITKEIPLDQKHAQELRELAKEGLCKMNLRGIGAHDVVVITHKNVPYKISQDFIANDDEVSIFLDRSEDKPAECHLYRSSCPMPTIYLAEEEYNKKRKREDELMKHCTEMVIKKKKA